MKKRKVLAPLFIAVNMLLGSIQPALAVMDERPVLAPWQDQTEEAMTEQTVKDNLNGDGSDQEPENAVSQEEISEEKIESEDAVELNTEGTEMSTEEEKSEETSADPGESEEEDTMQDASVEETEGECEEESEDETISLDVMDAAAERTFSDISFEIYWASAAGSDVTDYHYDDSDVEHHDLLVCTPVNNYNKTVNLRWEIILSDVEITYPAGSIKITVPATIFNNWEGGIEKVSYTDAGVECRQLSWQLPQAPGSNDQSDFNYIVDDDGNYIVTNCRDINGGKTVAFTADYSYRPTMVPGGYTDTDGNYRGNYLNRTIISTLSVDPDLDGQADYSTQDTAHVEIHTQVKPTAITKKQPASDQDANLGIYFSWQNKWGDRPSDAEDYFYVVWFVDVSRNIGTTQPFVIDMEDWPENEGVVVGMKQQPMFALYTAWSDLTRGSTPNLTGIAAAGWESRFHNIVGVSGETTKDSQALHLAMMNYDGAGRTMYSSNRYAVLVKYPVTLINNLEDGELLTLKNTLELTETWKAGADVQTKRRATGTLSIALPKNEPGYGIIKTNGMGTTAAAWTIGGAASFLIGGNSVNLVSPQYNSYLITSTARPKELPISNVDGSYTAKPYTMEVVDGDVTIGTGINGATVNGKTYNVYAQEAARNVTDLEDGDYSFTRISITLNAYDAQYSTGAKIWTKETTVSTAYDRYGSVDVWYRTAGSSEFNLYGTAVTATDGKMTFASADGSYTVAGGTRTCTIALPDSVCEFKLLHTSDFFETNLVCVPVLQINGTDHVKTRVKTDLDRGYAGVIVSNNAYLRVLDQNGTVVEGSQKDTKNQPAGRLSFYLSKLGYNTVLEKSVEGSVQDVPVDGVETRTVALTAYNSVAAPSEYKKEPYLNAYRFQKGVFYDLLPVGTSVDLDTVRIGKWVQSNITPTFSKYCKARTVDNWENSGHTMLIIEYEIEYE